MALLILQSVHSAIFAISLAATAWLWLCLISGRRSRLLWFAMVWLGLIAVGLILNGGVCPLQTLARHIEQTDEYVQDMLTPEWFNDLVVPVLAPPAAIAIAALGFVEIWKMRRR